MKRYVELRSAEGGEDAKLFVKDLAIAYMKYFNKVGWTTRLLDSRDGECILEVQGENLLELNKEAGGHRLQRVSPTEKRGRVHSSTVTVAVLNEQKIKNIEYNNIDFKIEWYSGTGKGGQARNKNQTCCRLIYLPTGLIQTAQTRSRENSFTLAKEQILIQLNQAQKLGNAKNAALIRKNQVGSGMRGDKIRTYQFCHNIAKDHVTGKSARLNDVLAGNFNLLW